MEANMDTWLVFMSLLSTTLSLSCTSRLDYLSAKVKLCAAGELCYSEEKTMVQRVVEDGCLRIKEDSPSEDGDYGRMRTYVVTKASFLLKEGQLLRLPAVEGSRDKGEGEEEEETITPIVEVFSLEGGKIVHTVENGLDPNNDKSADKAPKKT